mmetsp:Transcript_30691/g.56276  ORF Transcript_30691/g.56276 Transcript_30691/m.56276 type:complete len:363 (-) Transcript_30691:959-2047(-)
MGSRQPEVGLQSAPRHTAMCEVTFDGGPTFAHREGAFAVGGTGLLALPRSLMQGELRDVNEVISCRDILSDLNADTNFTECQDFFRLVKLNPDNATDSCARNFNSLALLNGDVGGTLHSPVHAIDVYEEGTEPMATAICSICDLDAPHCIISSKVYLPPRVCLRGCVRAAVAGPPSIENAVDGPTRNGTVPCAGLARVALVREVQPPRNHGAQMDVECILPLLIRGIKATRCPIGENLGSCVSARPLPDRFPPRALVQELHIRCNACYCLPQSNRAVCTCRHEERSIWCPSQSFDSGCVAYQLGNQGRNIRFPQSDHSILRTCCESWHTLRAYFERCIGHRDHRTTGAIHDHGRLRSTTSSC